LITLDNILEKLPPVNMKREVLVKYHVVEDIVDGTLNMHKKAAAHYDKIADMFWQGNDVATAKYLFKFVSNEIPYSVESKNDQTGKYPARILHDAKVGGKNDCKHYALFVVGVMDSLKRQGYNINPIYVFASDTSKKYASHVFAGLKRGKELIWVDPVLDSFNESHKYYYIKEFEPPAIMYSHLSGVNNNTSLSCMGWVDEMQIGAHGKGREKLRHLEKGLKTDLKNIQPGKFLLKVSMSTSRNAFLGLLKVNAFQMAARMFESAQTAAGKAKLQHLWRGVGGRWANLAHNINEGYKHYLFEHKRHMPSVYHSLSGADGISGPEIPALLAAAAPVLKAFSDLLKQLGAHPGDGAMAAATAHVANLHNKGALDSKVAVDADGNQVMNMKSLPGTGANNLDGGPVPAGGGDLMPAANADGSKGGSRQDEDDKEVPDTGAGSEAVNVATDFTKGIKNFVNENKTWLAPTAALGLAVLLVRSATGHSPKKR
jgi:hypothetical protein